MIRLLKIEFHKMLYYRTFWIIIGLYIVLIAPIAFGFESILSSFVINTGKPGQSSLSSLILGGYSVFDFPEVWLNMAYLASWFKLLLAIIVVILVTNEYSYRTLRQNIIDGMSKWEIIQAKELMIIAISLMATLLLVFLTLLLGNYKGNNILDGSGIIFAYFFSLMLYLNFTYLISSWLKKSGFVIGMLFLYTLVIENLISWKLPDYISCYFPMNLIGRMIPNPLGKLLGKSVLYDFSPMTMMVCLGYITLFIFLNYRMLKKGHAGK